MRKASRAAEPKVSNLSLQNDLQLIVQLIHVFDAREFPMCVVPSLSSSGGLRISFSAFDFPVGHRSAHICFVCKKAKHTRTEKAESKTKTNF